MTAAVTTATLFVSACSSESSSTETDPSPEPTSSTVSDSPRTSTTAPASDAPATAEPASTTASRSTTASPSTPDLELEFDTQLSWFLDVLNGAEVTEADYERRFAPVFTDQISYADFVALTPQIAGGEDGWAVAGDVDRTGLVGVFRVAPAAGTPVFSAVLAVTTEGRIETLSVQPNEAPSLDDPPESFDDGVARLSEFGQLGLLVADVSSGVCEPIDEVRGASPVPIASAVKLYVLGAVAAAVARGDLAWDAEILVTADLASLPSGVTQDEEPGTALTVLELATRMISISDNTATDMLVDAVGREAVIEIQSTMGHDAPELNRPFLTTRELFIIKYDAELLEQYATADPAERQATLDDIADRPLPSMSSEVAQNAPWRPDAVEWFASSLDLCEALVYLAERAEEAGLEPIRDMMTLNPGVVSETADEIWFKGGSEPGVFAAAWLVEQGDRTLTVTGSVVNLEEAFDETEAILLFAAIRDLVE